MLETLPAIFIILTIFLYMILMTLTILPWYTGMILAIVEFFGLHHVRRFACLNMPLQIVTRFLPNKPTYTENVTASPYFSGIIFGFIVWVALAWVSRPFQREFPFIATAVLLTSCILETDSHTFAHLTLSFGLCAYNFFRSTLVLALLQKVMQNSSRCVIPL